MSNNIILEYLYGLERKGIKLGLEPTQQLLERCGNPHMEYPSIQIAGTNGKGSTAAIAASIINEHGLLAGLYTSPHLVHFNERIRVGSDNIPNAYIISWVEKYQSAIEELESTFFETTTVLALTYFAECGIDLAILETGLGGRLDSTTAAEATISAITPIDFDHTEMLGDTIDAIAGEKAAIMRHGRKCYSAPQSPPVAKVLADEAERIGAELRFIAMDPGIPAPRHLSGDHQRTNATLANEIAREMLETRYSPKLAHRAIEKTEWPGRYQVLRRRPRVIFDVAHNPHSVTAFINNLDNESRSGNKWLVIALQEGKDAAMVMGMLVPKFDRLIITQTGVRYSLDADYLASTYEQVAMNYEVIADPVAAIRAALTEATSDDLVVILGSHYLGPAVSEVFENFI